MKMSSTSTTRILIMINVKLLFTFICFNLIVSTASTINKSPLSSTLSTPSSSPSKISSLSSRTPGLSSGSTLSVRCPLPHLIKPCDCIEIEKGVDSEFKDSELTDSTNETDILDDEISADETSSNINREPHPDTIETVVFCKHIYSRKQLIESMKAFSGHRINYLVIDSCSIPPFPTNIFNKIHIMWMEVLNSTIQFRESFFECGANCL